MNAALESFPAVPGTSDADRCFVCNKRLADDQWFCWMPEHVNAADKSQGKILLCSSACAFRYFAAFEIGAALI